MRNFLCILFFLCVVCENFAYNYPAKMFDIADNHYNRKTYYVALGYTYSLTNEITADFGRSIVKTLTTDAIVGYHTSRTVGIGYIRAFNLHDKDYVKLFGEFAYTITPIPFLPFSTRVELLSSSSFKNVYARPYIGMSFILFDIQYSYAFPIVGNENGFKHGITARFKLFPGQTNNKKDEKK